FPVGGHWLFVRPRGPLVEDKDRFLLILFPAAVAVECLAAVRALPRWLAWALRLALAGGAARLLLHGSTYITDLSGPDTREWTVAEERLILGGLAVALAAAWVLLSLLVRVAPGRSVPLSLALTCAGAGVTVMLSGYFSGG